MKQILVFGICIFSLGILSCSRELDKREYVQWIQSYENELHQRVSFCDYVLDVQYQPIDYMLLQQTQGNIQRGEIDSLRKDISDLQYYLLTIEVKHGKEDLIKFGAAHDSEVQERLYYYSYQFQNDIHLEEGGHELPCALFHFERSFDLRTSRTFVLGFENRNANESILIVNSIQLGGTPIKIKILKDNIPVLHI